MTFQIKKLILWPKKEGKSVRTVDFALNKVNVITGDSRTGKSAIVPIIDYCLASSDCLIPRDIIRDNVTWYGLLVSLGGVALIVTPVLVGAKLLLVALQGVDGLL